LRAWTTSELRNCWGLKESLTDACYDLNSRDGDDGDAQASDSEKSIAVDDTPPDAGIRNDSCLQPWYPEDATAAVWSQDADDISSGVEMAMKENLIHCGLDRQDGVCKIFVLPETSREHEKSSTKSSKDFRRNNFAAT
jgi:hypothetical protein